VWAFVDPSATSVLLAPAAVAVGVTLPDAIVARMARARQERILVDLPDVLDQLTVCVEAGLGFDAALARVAGTNHGPLGGEIGRVLQDVNVGIPRRDALERLVERTAVPELRQFVHAVAQAESYGMPVASVLRAQAAEQRARRSSRAEERAQKMPVKIVFPLVFCILPAMFVVVIGPAAIRLFRTFG
jgi:tight adherence protein C